MASGTPGRKCSICTHKNRPAIDAALLAGQEQRAVSLEYGVSADAVSRHKARHLSAAAAAEAPIVPGATAAGPMDVIAGLVDLQGRVLALLRRAERARNIAGALGAIKTAASLLETHARITGQLAPNGTVNVGVQFGSRGQNVEAIRQDVMEKLAAMAGACPTIEGTATNP